VVSGRPLKALWFTHVVPGPLAAAVGEAAAPGPAAWVETLVAAAAADGRATVDVVAPVVLRSRVRAGFSHVAGPVDDGGVRYWGIACRVPADGLPAAVDRWRATAEPPGLLDAAAGLVRRLAPYVVHVHGTEGPLGLLACRADVTPPVVVSLQGIVTAWRACVLCGLTAPELLRLAADGPTVKGWGVLHEYRSLAGRARRERYIMRGADLLLGRTGWDRAVARRIAPAARYAHCDELLRPAFWAARNATLDGAVEDGLDVGGAEAGDDGGEKTRTAEGLGCGSRRRPRAPEPVVFSTSSDLPGKGTESLLAAFAELRRRRSVRLRVAGVTPGSQLDALYRRRADRLGVADAVEWLGRLDAESLAGELAAADVFAYPSHGDNSPNSLCEAMLVGAPCVATAVGGIPSLLDGGGEGILVPDHDPTVFAAAVERLLDDPALAEGLARAAHRRAVRRHDPRHVVEQLVGAYREAVGGEPAAAAGAGRRPDEMPATSRGAE